MAGSTDNATRMLCREYQWDRHLTKWESLPRLRLEPHRILFDCLLCCYTNTLGETCPWCLSACKARGPDSAAARRRISCPQLLSEAQRVQMWRSETRSVMATGSPCAVSSVQPEREAARGRVKRARTSTQTTRRQKRRRAGIHSTADIVATITYDVEAELKPFLKELMNMYDDDHTTLSTPNDSVKPSNADRLDSMIDDTKNMDALSTSTTSQRTLRRKQRMAMLRKRSSRSLRKRSMPLLSKTSSRLADNYDPAITVQPVLPSRSPSPASLVPLGHPERPLYTAIRRNMCPPGLPPPQSDIRHTSIQAVLFERGAKSLDMPRPATLGRSSRLRELIPASDWTAGCSITGEAELRMDLARCRSAEVVSYRPREANLGGVVREKVKNLGKGLRELLTRRT
ncbi:hypothetical protein DAEQUDRAFT_511033 [Daedalea quercina L-15889]|uniref:Uncharacterized protein n=1 Tax=Daedalea quercina L-15889 TaxID=1314783 RepID=A0A165TBA2_9APHY|nr:hypothetical protein DAEQUDRAFT_511033 [Daedalea quercina L-15889]